jgi:hypothetical protein
MRQNGAGAGIGVAGLVGLLAVAGCASAGGGAAAGRTIEDPHLVEARTAIARRIATTVDAIERKDVDALLGNSIPEWRTADGRRLTKAEVREAVLREWAPVERTVELTVQVDSVNMVSDAAALVFTSQLWQRILVGPDGKRHDVTTTSEVEQAWGRTADDWRGTGPARVLRAATRVDGKDVGGGGGVLASRPY